MKTPEVHNYFSGEPVSCRGGAVSEVLLSASVGLNHNSVLWAIWDKGIAPLETQIMGHFQQAPQFEREVEKVFGDILDVKTFGVLLIATVFESKVVNQDTKTPQRFYHNTHIETVSFSYESAAKLYQSRDKLLPAKKDWKIAFYHIWAVRS